MFLFNFNWRSDVAGMEPGEIPGEIPGAIQGAIQGRMFFTHPENTWFS